MTRASPKNTASALRKKAAPAKTERVAKPADPSRRSVRLEARVTPENLAVIRRAAEIQGRSLSDFVVVAAQEAAHRAIEETQVIRLSMEDQKRLVEALLDPPPYNAALQRAFKRHRELFGDS